MAEKSKSLDIRAQEAQAKDEYLVALGRLHRPDLAIEAVNKNRPTPLRISYAAVNRWKEQDDYFRQMCEYWGEFLKARLEGTAYEMALGEGEFEKPDGAMLRFMLKAEMPEKYGNKVSIQQNTSTRNSYLPPIIDVESKPVTDE